MPCHCIFMVAFFCTFLHIFALFCIFLHCIFWIVHLHFPPPPGTGAQGRGTRTAHQNLDMRDTRTPPLQGMRDHTPGGQALLLSGTSVAPTSAHGVPSGRKPHPGTRTGGPTSQSTDPDGQGGVRAKHPRPQTACAAHADEWGPTPGGAEGPRRGRSRPAGGQKTAGTRTPPPRE